MSSSHERQLGNLNKTINYKEPDHHHQLISDKLRTTLQNKKYITICCMSSKDYKLANEIKSQTSESNNVAIKYGIEEARKADIILSTRWLEHCNHNEQIDKLFSNIAVGGILMIECLSYKELFEKGNHSYLWDERVSYFDREYIKKHCLEYRLEEIFSYQDESQQEPFWTIALQKKAKSLMSDHRNQNMEKKIIHERVKIEESLSILRKRCKYYNSLRPSRVCFIGIGHKAQFAATVLKDINKNIDIKLYDSSSLKIGAYWERETINDIDSLLSSKVSSKCCHYAFSFNGVGARKLQEKLMHEDSKALFTNIYDWYKDIE